MSNEPNDEEWVEELFDEHFPVGTVTTNDRKDDDKALLMTQVLEYRRNNFKAAILSRLKEARIDELNPIIAITDKMGDDYGEFEALDDIEAHATKRLASLTQPTNKETSK